MFPNEVAFRVSDNIHRHNVRIWGTENPHIVREHISDSPKVDVCFVMDEVRTTKGVLSYDMKNFESFTTSPSKVHCVQLNFFKEP